MPPKKKPVKKVPVKKSAPPAAKIVSRREIPAEKAIKPVVAVNRPVLPALSADRPAGRFIEAIGRRKTSVARVRLFLANGLQIKVNEKPLESYFGTYELRNIVEAPFKRSGLKANFEVSAKVSGGGIHSQAEAVRHGISRALEEHDPLLRKVLKPLGFLKRDPRMKERRKFGLKKARKAPQWAKR